MPGRSNGWWISPAIPTIANAVLAVLWGFSALGGWGDTAFCGDADQHDPGCGDDFGFAVRLSIPFAVLAALIGVAAWSLPRVRHNPARLDALLTVGAFLWVLAEGVLFVGGYLAKP